MTTARPPEGWYTVQPPYGVWTYSVAEGLFRINRRTETNYLEVLKVVQFDRDRLETGTVYQIQVKGPFVYPMPDPTKGLP